MKCSQTGVRPAFQYSSQGIGILTSLCRMGVSLFPSPPPQKKKLKKGNTSVSHEDIGFESLGIWFVGESYEPFKRFLEREIWK